MNNDFIRALVVALGFVVFCAAFGAPSQGVTRKQLEKTVDGINSNMSQMVSAEISKNVDGYIDRIAKESAAAATNFLPTFIEGLGTFASLNEFMIEEFTTNSLTFRIHSISNGTFVSERHTAYFTAEWVQPTNHGYQVISSNIPEIPAGTPFLMNPVPIVEGTHPAATLNSTGQPSTRSYFWWATYELQNADIFSKPMELVCLESRYESGAIVTNRVICEKGLYRVVVSAESSTPYQTAYKASLVQNESATSPNWTKVPEWDRNGRFHILSATFNDGVFKMAAMDDISHGDEDNDDIGEIFGTFTLVPCGLNDAQAETARNGSPKVSALRRAWRRICQVFVSDAHADDWNVFADAAGMPIFRVTWRTKKGDYIGEYDFPISKTPPMTKVDDKGQIYSGPDTFNPFPWYPLHYWCDIEQWLTFPVTYCIYYATSSGGFVNDMGIRYSTSWRSMHIAQFKNLFLGCAEGLRSIYRYPSKVEKTDPCATGKHPYLHCKCMLCGKVRDHDYQRAPNGCVKCVREEASYTKSDDGEIKINWQSSTICGHIPDGEENHSGWRMVGPPDNVHSEYLMYCGCACGHYSDNNEYYQPQGYQGNRIGPYGGLMHLTLDHEWNENHPDAENWQPGDENGNDEESMHHARLPCRRDCGARRVITEGHNFYKDDGSLWNCSVEYVDDVYHAVKGECSKCTYPTETIDMHLRVLPDDPEGEDTCRCVGSVTMNTSGCGELVHKFVVTVCNEIRCLYCLAPRPDFKPIEKDEHYGVQEPGWQAGDRKLRHGQRSPVAGEDTGDAYGYVLRVHAPDEKGHWCGCGLYQVDHNMVDDDDANQQVCPWVSGLLWWAQPGCGYTRPKETEQGKFDATITTEYNPRSPYNLQLTAKGNSSFVWRPLTGEAGPTPADLWPGVSNAPQIPPLPPVEMVTSVDFTFALEASPITYTIGYSWDGERWKKQGSQSWWEKIKWWLKNTPILFRP